MGMGSGWQLLTPYNAREGSITARDLAPNGNRAEAEKLWSAMITTYLNAQTQTSDGRTRNLSPVAFLKFAQK